VGCGPGSLTLLLAPWVAEATGVDADPGMIAEAEDLAVRAGVRNVRWRVLRAAERRAGQGVLPDGTPSGEERSYRTAGFSGPRRLELPGQLVERSADEVMPRSSPPNSPAGSRGRDGGAHFGGLIRGARASMSPVVRGRV
jgi:hypothetical protein